MGPRVTDEREPSSGARPHPSETRVGTLAVFLASLVPSLVLSLVLPVGASAQACVGRAGLEPGKFELKVRGDAKVGAGGQTSHYFEDRSIYAFNRFVSFSRESISDSSHGLWETVGMLAVGAEFNKLNPYGGFAGARTSSSFGQVSCSPPSSTCRTEVADLTEWYWWIGLSYRFSDRLRGAVQGREGGSNLWIGWIL